MTLEEEKSLLDSFEKPYRKWFLETVKHYPDQREELLQIVTKWDSEAKEKIRLSSGYIGVKKAKINQDTRYYWSSPKIDFPVDAPLYLLAKDRVTFTRDLDEALYIKGNPVRYMNIDFVADGHRYFFVSESEVKTYLACCPPRRKPITKAEREATYAKFDGHCAYCGCPITYEEMEVDHFVSHKTNFGKDELDNYMPACHDCNHVKVDYTIDQFRNAIRHCGEIHRARKYPIMAISDRISVKYALTEQDHEIKFHYEKIESKGK